MGDPQAARRELPLHVGLAPPAAFILILAALGCYLWLLMTPGTSDVSGFWLRWIGLMREHGLVGGYRLADSDYLPLAFISLRGVDLAAGACGLETLLALKLGLALAALVSVTVFWWRGRNVWHAAGLLFALVVSAVAHGYLDVLFLPPLLLSLVALERRRLVSCGAWFSVALAMKWQPLIVAPFFLIQASRAVQTAGSGALDVGAVWRALVVALTRLVAGAAPVLLACGVVFGVDALYASFNRALGHHALSLQALNLNWIVQMLAYKHRHLSGFAYFELLPPRAAVMAAKTLFAGTYALFAITLAARGQTFADFLWCMCAGALAYFTFSTGVHENHLFLAMVLAFALLWTKSPDAAPMALLCGVLANINLLVFYGLEGRGPIPTPLFDAVTVAFSLVNTAFAAACVYRALRWWRGTSS